MSLAESSPAATPTSGWRRLSPIAVVFFAGTFVRRLISDGLPALAGLGAWSMTLDGGWRERLLVLGVAVMAVALLYAVAAYLRFRYRLESHQVSVQRGVFQREELSVDLNRIQNVQLRQPFYAGWFGVAFVELDTAGARGREIKLGGVPIAAARSLRDAAAAQRRTPVTHATAAASPDDQELHRATATDLVAYGVSNPSLLWTALIGVAAGQYFDALRSDLGVAFLDSWFRKVAPWEAVGAAIPLVAIVVALGLVFAFLAIAAAFVRYHGYRLCRRDDNFVRLSGLMTRDEQVIRAEKIQSVVVRQNWLMRLFGRVNLQLHQANAGVADATENFNPRSKRFLVPGVPAARAPTLLAHLAPGARVSGLRLTRPDPAFVRHVVLRRALPLGALAGLVTGYFISWWCLLPAASGIALAWAIVHRWRRQAGFAFDGDLAYWRHGLIGHRWVVFAPFRCQYVTLRTSPYQRRRRLAGLQLHLASQSLSMPYVSYRVAESTLDYCLYAVERSRERWL